MKDIIDLIQSITAIIAVIIACISIRYTMKSIKEQKKHEELSVKPILNVGIGNYPNSICISLFNKGMGPATVKKVEIYYTQKEKTITENSIIEIINRLYPNFIISDGFLDLTGFTFLPNESINIFLIEREQNINHKAIQEALACITGRIYYSDIYKNDHIYDFELKRFSKEPYKQMYKRPESMFV